MLHFSQQSCFKVFECVAGRGSFLSGSQMFSYSFCPSWDKRQERWFIFSSFPPMHVTPLFANVCLLLYKGNIFDGRRVLSKQKDGSCRLYLDFRISYLLFHLYVGVYEFPFSYCDNIYFLVSFFLLNTFLFLILYVLFTP